MLKKLILDGQVPYLMTLKKVLFWLALVLPLYIFIEPREFGEFGEIGWTVLIAVMLIRPFADIFPDIKLLRTLTMFRREFGILAVLLLVAHFVGYFMVQEISVWEGMTNFEYWQSAACGWGFIGIIFAIPVLLTSNKLSMILLKRKWKGIQSLAYIFFIFGGIHISMLGEEEGLVAVIFVAVLWLLAKFGFKIKLPKLNKP